MEDVKHDTCSQSEWQLWNRVHVQAAVHFANSSQGLFASVQAGVCEFKRIVGMCQLHTDAVFLSFHD